MKTIQIPYEQIHDFVWTTLNKLSFDSPTLVGGWMITKTNENHVIRYKMSRVGVSKIQGEDLTHDNAIKLILAAANFDL